MFTEFIGRGSFGRIYLASDKIDGDVTKQNARYVVKIEPHTNGPLFVEIHCLIRSAQAPKGELTQLCVHYSTYSIIIIILCFENVKSSTGIVII